MTPSKGRVRTALLLSLFFLLTAAPASSADPAGRERAQRATLQAGIAWQRQTTWRWQDIAFVHRTRASQAPLARAGIPYLRYVARMWNSRRQAARAYALHPPHEQLWLCVHGNEQSAWNDPDSPYWGGMQMSQWFMDTYGPELLASGRTADRWTPLEQMWVAERAFKREGYSVAWFNGQWPPSAGRCGL